MPFEEAPFGVTGLETAFAALNTHLVEPGLLPLATLLERMSAGPARAFGLEPPRIAVGAPANLVLLDPEATWRVGEERLPLALDATRGCSGGRCRAEVAADGRSRPVAGSSVAGGRVTGLPRARGRQRSSAASRSAPRARAFGEAVFTTAMTGYQETVTDPSYAGQIVCFTAPMVGNYGVADERSESGAVARHGGASCARRAGRPGRTGSREQRHRRARPGSTRARSCSTCANAGAMRAAVVAGRRARRRGARGGARRSRRWQGARSSPASPRRAVHVRAERRGAGRGGRLRRQALDPAPARAARARPSTVFPHDVDADTLAGYDGVLLSQRPGRPGAARRARRRTVRELLGRVPVLGICLGHQLLGARHRSRDLQAPVRPPRREPSGARARHRPRARHLAEPRLRGRSRRGRARRRTSRSTTARSRGFAFPSCAPGRCSSTPRPARARTTAGRSSPSWVEELRQRCLGATTSRRSA